jgi:hypothetical protein
MATATPSIARAASQMASAIVTFVFVSAVFFMFRPHSVRTTPSGRWCGAGVLLLVGAAYGDVRGACEQELVEIPPRLLSPNVAGNCGREGRVVLDGRHQGTRPRPAER